MPLFEIESLKMLALQILKAYAWILFLNNPIIGGIFLCLSFWQPNIGAAGLLAAITASFVVNYFKFSYRESGIHLFNAILVGLSIGAFYVLDGSLILLIIISATLTVFLTVMLMNIFTKFGALPVLTTPFVIVAITTAFAAKSFGNLSNNIPEALVHISWLPNTLDNFFTALGSIFFLPNPIIGAILFLGILWQSRYLAFLCICGFASGFTLYEHFSAAEHLSLAIYNGFNFSLTAMALGAIYAVPSLVSFSIAILGATIAALVATAAQSFMSLYNLSVMATPFILTTLTILSALNTRQSVSPPWLRLETPDLPEIHYERARLATYRIGDINSVPLSPPFFGTWHIYQGFNGKHTHQPPWQHALDFIILEDNNSFKNRGLSLEDYYCYGLPIKSPTYGTVVRTVDNLPDNAPGEVDIKNNWGNFVLIQLDSGLFVLLAHLKHSSVKVNENDRIEPGQIVAACGNSGRSPQPHLHLQVQTTALLGSNTYPFHLTSINLQQQNSDPEFKLVSVPKETDAITPLETDAALASALHLPVGRSLCYEVITPGKPQPTQRKLHVTLSLLGEFRLVSDSGASAGFLESNGILAFYDRHGKKDEFLDMWLLALGLTPFSDSVTNWQDSPSILLLPLTRSQKFVSSIFFPLGTGFNSVYQREYDIDNNYWSQSAEHKLTLGINNISFTSQAKISRKGCEKIELTNSNDKWIAKLLNVDQEDDIGIHINKHSI